MFGRDAVGKIQDKNFQDMAKVTCCKVVLMNGKNVVYHFSLGYIPRQSKTCVFVARQQQAGVVFFFLILTLQGNKITRLLKDKNKNLEAAKKYKGVAYIGQR